MGDGLHPEGRPISRATMRRFDQLPTEFRQLANDYGERVVDLWLQGWSGDDVRAAVMPDGTLSRYPAAYVRSKRKPAHPAGDEERRG